MENDQKCCRKDNYFLQQISVKVTLPGSRNDTTLYSTTHVIKMIFYDGFYLHANASHPEIVLGKILL